MNVERTKAAGIARSPPRIGLDTTFVLCANSYLFPTATRHLTDEGAREALADLLVYLCNGKQIAYARPGMTKPATKVPLLAVVDTSAFRPTYLSLNPTYTPDLMSNAAEDFLRYLDAGNHEELATWVRFQFDDDSLAQIFFEGGRNEQLERLRLSYDALMCQPKVKAACKRWAAVSGLPICLPEKHSDAAEKIRLSGAQYSFVYAFFGFAKGQTYALQIPREIPSREHWLRAKASKLLRQRQEERDVGTPDPNPEMLCFDWARYLLVAFDHYPDCKDRLRDIVELTRERTTWQVFSEIVNAGVGKSPSKAMVAVRDAADRFAWQTLKEVGIRPILRDPKGYRDDLAVWGKVASGVWGAALAPLIGNDPQRLLYCGAAGLVCMGWISSQFRVAPQWYQNWDLRWRWFSRAKVGKDFLLGDEDLGKSSSTVKRRS